MRFDVSIVGAAEAADAFGKQARRLEESPRDVLQTIAEHWAESVFPSVFDRGGDPPWEPLSPVSVELRGPGKPLEGEGILRRSLRILGISDLEAEVGTDFGEIHQTGGRTSPASMIPDREIPARPFLSLDPTAIEDALGRISEFYFREVS